MSSSPNNPVGPLSNPPPTPPPTTPPSSEAPGTTSGSEQTASQSTQQLSWEDPAGAWQKFLGPTASARDVQMFIDQLMKFFSNVIMRQSNEASKRAYQAMKDSIEGKG